MKYKLYITKNIKNMKYEIYKIYAVTVALNKKRSAKYDEN